MRANVSAMEEVLYQYLNHKYKPHLLKKKTNNIQDVLSKSNSRLANNQDCQPCSLWQKLEPSSKSCQLECKSLQVWTASLNSSNKKECITVASGSGTS